MKFVDFIDPLALRPIPGLFWVRQWCVFSSRSSVFQRYEEILINKYIKNTVYVCEKEFEEYGIFVCLFVYSL